MRRKNLKELVRWLLEDGYTDEGGMAPPPATVRGAVIWTIGDGRDLGVWNGEILPVRWEKVEVSLRDAFRIRRIYRRLAKRKGSGSLRCMSVFVRHENMLRLLEFLGCQLE